MLVNIIKARKYVKTQSYAISGWCLLQTKTLELPCTTNHSAQLTIESLKVLESFFALHKFESQFVDSNRFPSCTLATRPPAALYSAACLVSELDTATVVKICLWNALLFLKSNCL